MGCAEWHAAAQRGRRRASAREAAAVASSTPDAGARCAPVIGWDIGGAHVKASLLEAGTVTAIGQWATPLWKGLAHLDEALHAARARWPAFAHARHAVTMTAEMTDLFPDREAGVRALCAHLADRLGAATRFYAGEAGWLDAGAAAAGHVVNLGHGVPPDTDPQVLTDLVAFLHAQGTPAA